MVLTPPGACKTSRNWMPPAGLLRAAYHVLLGTQGERAKWLGALCRRPLRNLLTALQRLHLVEPAAFRKLAANSSSHTQLRLALSHAMSLAPRHTSTTVAAAAPASCRKSPGRKKEMLEDADLAPRGARLGAVHHLTSGGAGGGGEGKRTRGLAARAQSGPGDSGRSGCRCSVSSCFFCIARSLTRCSLSFSSLVCLLQSISPHFSSSSPPCPLPAFLLLPLS
jgi:hypothetical protein